MGTRNRWIARSEAMACVNHLSYNEEGSKLNIQNPHDKFFKETFGNIEIAKDFLKNYLPVEIVKIIDVSTLEPQKDSFINEDLQETFSDMLFRVDMNHSEGYIYFLFEHKSYTSRNISFQLLKYMIEIWEAKIKKENCNVLPMIIPLVIYHGNDKWNVQRMLSDMIVGYQGLPKEVQKYIPNYEYILYDISRYTDEEIIGEARLRILLTVFRDIFSKDKNKLRKSVLNAAEALARLADKQTGVEYFETYLRYILSAGHDLTKTDMNEIIVNIGRTYPEGSDAIMTLADRFREEGIEQGVLLGMEKGEAQALVKTIIRLLTKKFGSIPEDLKKEIFKLDAATLELMIDDILIYQKVEDIKKYWS